MTSPCRVVESAEEPTSNAPAWGDLDSCFTVDQLCGTARFILPIRLSPGRLGFGPDLRLTYDSSVGNSAFGFGWALDAGFIGRRTLTQVPRFGDADEDAFEIGDDELVPALKKGGTWAEDRTTIGEYKVQRYRRRHETTYDRIERWTHPASGQTYWRCVDADNITSVFGATRASRVSDPYEPGRTVRWLLTERYDDRGNIIRYTYESDGAEIDLREKNNDRERRSDADGGRYLKRIQYGNAAPHDRNEWHFQAVFDYGDHSETNPKPEPSQAWPIRPDVFSDRRSGFEVRTRRLCRRVLMFHTFEELAPGPVLVGATSFDYDDSTGTSMLSSAEYTGYITHDGAITSQRSLPPVSFDYKVPYTNRGGQDFNAATAVAAFVDGSGRARWTDLHDEGLPGVLSRTDDQWVYVRNLGKGRFANAEPVADVATQEVLDNQAVVDLAAESRRVDELAHERAYQPLGSMRTAGDGGGDETYIGYLDLNGDDSDDVVVADEKVIRWYPSQGAEGFGDPIVLRIDRGDFSTARVLHVDECQSLHIADMTGDGLYDLVRVRSGETCYWPHFGRGRFGDRIDVGNAPAFPEGGRVLLADVTGAGGTDVVWVGNNEIRSWINLHGTAFSEVNLIEAPGISPAGPGLGAVDLLGDGVSGIAWVDPTAGEPVLRYVMPMGDFGRRSLAQMSNGRGLETRLGYSSSTEFWLRDRSDGGAWLTTVPTPVAAVEHVETYDHVSRLHTLVRYAYHHGHFDVSESRFAGFALVERWDSGTDDDYERAGLFAELPVLPEEAHRRPVPRLTKTWLHTGTQFEDADLSVPLKEQFFEDPNLSRRKWLPGHQLPLGQSAKEMPQSHRALRGQLLREEVYGLDGPPRQSVPFRVIERTAWVRQSQPPHGDKPAVYHVAENEHLTATYERHVTDPRVEHRMALSLDDYGVATSVANIAYGRRIPEQAGQGDHHILVTDRIYIADSEQPTWHRVSVLSQEVCTQLVSLKGPSGNRIFEQRDIRSALDSLEEAPIGVDVEDPHKRVVFHKRVRHWSNDSTRLLDLGELQSRALTARCETLCLTTQLAEQRFGPDAANALRFEGGYQFEGDNWWAPGPTTRYDSTRFYLPVSVTDSVGRVEKFKWNGSGLAIEQIEDAFGNIEHTEMHPRTLKMWRTADVNGVIRADRFDPLGLVLSSAVIGTNEEEGDAVDLSSIEATAIDNPTVVTTYDLEAWSTTRRPGWIRTRHRAEHQSSEAGLVDHVILLDGGGRSLGAAFRCGGSTWVLSDFVERDANGAVVLEAQPFFGDRTLPDTQTLRAVLDGGTRFTRDALGRTIRVDHPNGTFETVQINAWSRIESDSSDTVLESSWYAERQGATQGRAGDFAARQAQGSHYDMRAAALSAAHAKTPTTYLLDACGRVVVTHQDLGGGQIVERRIDRDWTGRPCVWTNSRGVVSATVHRDLLGRTIGQESPDGGTHTYALDASGKLLRRTDPHGRVTRYRYDRAGRVTHKVLSTGSGPEVLSERTIYGGGDVDVAHALEGKLIGRVHMRFTSIGLHTVHAYDVNGNATDCSVRPSRDRIVEPDWGDVSELSHTGQVEELLIKGDHSILGAEEILTACAFDALGRLQWDGNPDAGVIAHSYGLQGLETATRTLAAVDASSHGIVDEATHDASGRLLSLRAANGVHIERAYDAGRLSALTSVNEAGLRIQDLHIVRDARGCVMSISDAGELLESFTYDALGRMVRAEGLGAASSPGGERLPFVNTYGLDSEANLTEVQHKAGQSSFTRRLDYSAGRNQIRAMSTPRDPAGAFSATFQHDDAGNMIHDPLPRNFRWNRDGQLAAVQVGAEVVVHLGYDHDGELVRRVVERPGSVLDETYIIGCFERMRRYKHDALVFEKHSVSARHGSIPVVVIERVTHNDTEEFAELVVGTPQFRFPLLDHLGSAVMELAGDGDLIAEEAFAPFGTWAWRNARSTAELSTKRYGFRAGRHDLDTQLVLLGDRWYSPLLGRWLDAGTPAASNPYSFMGANPQHPPDDTDGGAVVRKLTALSQRNITALLG